MRRVDHHVEELVDGQHAAPGVAELLHVVRDDRRLDAAGTGLADERDDVRTYPRVAERTEGLEEIDAVLGRPDLHDRLARIGERQLPTLEAVPRMIGIVVVGAEDDLDGAFGGDPSAGTEGADRPERRIHEHTPEIEEHGVDGWHGAASSRFRRAGSSPAFARAAQPIGYMISRVTPFTAFITSSGSTRSAAARIGGS